MIKKLTFYQFHQDTIITAYFGNMHRSKEFWERPYEFYPEHFLTPDGKLRENVDGFLPFSIGIFKNIFI